MGDDLGASHKPKMTRPMLPDEYTAAVEELAAFARAHRAMAHPLGSWPEAECPTCLGIARRRRELAGKCPI